jgi:hypothetical protein
VTGNDGREDREKKTGREEERKEGREGGKKAHLLTIS